MSAADAREKLREAVVITSAGAEVWASNDCACDDCARQRARAKLRLYVLVSEALKDLRAFP